jgi:hypothetical protein
LRSIAEALVKLEHNVFDFQAVRRDSGISHRKSRADGGSGPTFRLEGGKPNVLLKQELGQMSL